MNEASGQGNEPNKFLDRWTNDEIQIELGPEHARPPRPITGKRLESLKALRALRARLDPKYRAHLESRGIFLTPEELQEPPPSGDSKEIRVPMNEASDHGHESNKFLDRWTNDEIQIELGPEHTQPPQSITGKRLESLKAERALRARLDPKYRAHLESRGIFLTPEELQEPPSDAKTNH